jgi:RNA polymerase sigma-70 factor (ECF subfamily)
MDAACDPEELVRLARAGDVAALDRLTRCQGDRLLAVGRRHCRSEEEARDAVQDALISAATHLPDYRGEGGVDAWVVSMVARACGRMRRGRKNDPHLHTFDVDLLSETDDPEREAARAELARTLHGALEELDPLDRAVLWLAEGAGWTGPEIAERLGTSADAVRARLTRARRRLKERLAGRLGDLPGRAGA